jgi:hypothetical protein
MKPVDAQGGRVAPLGAGRWRLVLAPGRPAAAGAYAPVEAVVRLAP